MKGILSGHMECSHDSFFQSVMDMEVRIDCKAEVSFNLAEARKVSFCADDNPQRMIVHPSATPFTQFATGVHSVGVSALSWTGGAFLG